MIAEDGAEQVLREDQRWSLLMPWLGFVDDHEAGLLDRLGPPAMWWSIETPRETAARHTYRRVATMLAELILDRRPGRTFQTLFSYIPEQLTIAELPPLSTRGRNALQRAGVLSLTDLAGSTAQDILQLRNVGRGTVVEILATLAEVSMYGPMSPVAIEESLAQQLTARSGSVKAQVTVPDAYVTLLEDLAEIARWRHLRGQGSSPVLIPVLDDAAPERVLAAQDRLADLTAADIVPVEAMADPVDQLDAILFSLGDRERFVLARRLLAPRPETLATIGDHLGVTQEWVRQIEQRLRDDLVEATAYGSAAGDLLGVLRAEIRPVAPLDRLLARYPVLARQVAAVEAPLWLVLDRLDTAFEVGDGWAAAPTVSEAVDQTRQLLEDLEDEHGLVPLKVAVEDLGHELDHDETERWLTYCGFEIRDEHVLTRTRSIPDRVAAILALSGTPVAFDDLVDGLEVERSPTSIRNALYADSRFTRVDRNVWALSDWGLDSYTGIRALIGQELDRNAGEVKLDELVESLVGRFTVSESSVVAYASSAPYELHDGVVRYRSADHTIRKDPCATRRLYRSGEGWLYRLLVTHDHLRGSGFPVPVGVASVVGCQPGRSVALPSPLGDQPVRWTGTQPAVGTIRRHLEHLGVDVGDLVFLRFGQDRTFDIIRADERWRSDDSLTRVLALTGVDPGFADNVDEALSRLAAVVCLPTDAEPLTILNAFRERGGMDIYELLVQAWDVLTDARPSPETTAQAVDTPASGDVMRMLGYE